MRSGVRGWDLGTGERMGSGVRLEIRAVATGCHAMLFGFCMYSMTTQTVCLPDQDLSVKSCKIVVCLSVSIPPYTHAGVSRSRGQKLTVEKFGGFSHLTQLVIKFQEGAKFNPRGVKTPLARITEAHNSLYIKQSKSFGRE